VHPLWRAKTPGFSYGHEACSRSERLQELRKI
jgi:hypothetical protein